MGETVKNDGGQPSSRSKAPPHHPEHVRVDTVSSDGLKSTPGCCQAMVTTVSMLATMKPA